MKPFNLEEAKAGKPVCTRDGKDVKILDFDYHRDHRLGDVNKPEIVAKITGRDGCERLELYTINGKKQNTPLKEDRDLMMKTEEHSGWVWLAYETIYETQDDAEKYEPHGRGDSYFLCNVYWEE